MRVGDFGVEVIPCDGGRVREVASGHVLARPGQVYRLRLRNFGPLYCVADVEIDGRGVTAGGLVLSPWSMTELERPVDEIETGRFTVIAEGSEAVFGADGGRDNADLGLINARFRRELPRGDRTFDRPIVRMPEPWHVDLPERLREPGIFDRPELSAMRTHVTGPAIERAAGTGLTGHSDQQFVPITLGPLETEATSIQLRIVIGTDAALAEAESQPVEHDAPARPAARP